MKNTLFLMLMFLVNTIFAATDYNGQSLVDKSFYGDELEKANFSKTQLSYVDFRYANLAEANFQGATLNGVDFQGATLYNADFSNVYLGAKSPYTSFFQAKADGANFSNLNFSGYRDYCFREGSFKNANFSGAYLGMVEFQYSNLTGANFSNVRFDSQTEFLNATITGANFSNIKYLNLEKFKESKSYKNKDLSGVIFNNNGSMFAEFNFSGQNLTGAGFWKNTFTTANFTNATIKNASFTSTTGFTSEKLYSTASYKNKDLQGIELGDLDLTNWNFTGQNLTNAAFIYSSNLTDVNFSNANLTNVNFNKANLLRANFTDATIKGVNFEASLNFTQENLYKTKSWKTKDLSSVKFTGLTMYEWDFSSQNLQNSSFKSATLTNVNLSNADLRGADLTDLKGSYITKNTIMSDGEIFSNDASGSENLGLILAEGETFTVSKYESPVATFSTRGNDISAKLTVDSTLNGGTIVLEDGALLEISEGVTLTLSDAVEFVVADGVNDISDVLSMGNNSTIVMAGCSDEEASGAFANLFKSEDGSSLEFTTPESFVIKGSQVPEPSTYAMIFGAIALGFVAYRRRK